MTKTILAGAMVLASALSSPPARGPEDAFSIAPTNSRIEFHANATFTKVIGVFHAWQADLKIPGGRLENATLSMEIQAASVKTGSGIKDKQVKGNNFFDVLVHPLIRFASTRVSPTDDPDLFLMDGDLTLRGVTKPVAIKLTLQPGKSGHQVLLGTCTFNRREFGMVHNVPFNKVADIVSVNFEFDISPGASEAVSAEAVGATHSSSGK